MGLVEAQNPVQPIGLGEGFDLNPETDAPATRETLGAAFERGSEFGSALAMDRVLFQAPPVDPDLDPWAEINGSEYEDEWRAFVGVRNRDQLEAMKVQVNRERENARTIAASGTLGAIAEMAAGLLSPVTLLPGGAVIRGFKVGSTAARTALSVGAAAGGAAAVSEAALQATQVTRTPEDSAIVIGGSVLLGNVLGAGIGAKVARSEFRAMSRGLEELDDVLAGVDDQLRSAGAAQVGVENLRLKKEDVIAMLPIINRQDPLIRTVLSRFRSVRETSTQLAETPLEFEVNAEGISLAPGGSVETVVKTKQSRLSRPIEETDRLYADYWKDGPVGRFGTFTSPIEANMGHLLGRSEKLTAKQFREEVGRAMIRGDQHPIPQVQNAAGAWRRYLFNPLKKEFEELGVFPEDITPDTAASYLTRIYNRKRIIAERPRLSGILFGRFKAKQQRTIKALQDAELAKSDVAIKDQDRTLADMTDGEITALVDKTINNILGTSEGRVPFDADISHANPLRARVLDIPDEAIEAFLERDIEIIGRRYFQTLQPEAELLRRFGDVEMTAQKQKINDEAADLLRAATDAKERKGIQAERDAAVRDLEAMRDRIRGVYGLPIDPEAMVIRASRVARSFNYMRLLGGMTVSAIPDIARPVMTEGWGRFYGEGLKTIATDFGRMKIAAGELKDLGAALDLALDSRVMAIADIGDAYGVGTGFERGVQAASQRFTMLTGMSHWNAGMKQFTGALIMSRILKAAKKVQRSAASKKDMGRLAASGIDRTLAMKIAEEFDRFGDAGGDLWLPQTGDWTNKEARQAFASAVVRDVDRAIVTPGQDRPLWMSNELGRVIGQFKSFAFASVQRTALAGLQDADAATLNGITMMMALGALTYAIKEQQAGREVSDDLAIVISNAFDRSGLMAWLADANQIVEAATRGRIGIAALTGEELSRYQARTGIGGMLGPTADLAADATMLSGAVFAGDLRESDIRRARRLLPLQNLAYLRWLFDQMERSSASILAAQR